MKKVKIKQNAWLARMAAMRLDYTEVAMVIGRTIYLHNTSINLFRNSKRWVTHELKHVEQYDRYGFIGFLWLYLIEYIKNGYHLNKYEIEAREAEGDETLLQEYHIIWEET